MAIALAILSSVFPKGVYKKRSVNLFQFSLLVNLFVLCGIGYLQHYNILNFVTQATKALLSLAFLSVVIFYLVDNRMKIKKRLMILKRWCCVVVKFNEQKMDHLQQQTNHVTYTEVTVSPEGSDERTPLIPAQLLPPVVLFDTPMSRGESGEVLN